LSFSIASQRSEQSEQFVDGREIKMRQKGINQKKERERGREGEKKKNRK